MEICDFCSVMRIIRDYISDARALSQTDLLYEVFASFMADDENADYDFDNALVCRWMNGQAAVSPRISKYYLENNMEDVLSEDVLNNVVPLFYDGFMCAERLYDLLMLDSTVSSMKKDYISEGYPYKNTEQIATFIGRLIYFVLQRKFVKKGSDNELAISEGKMSPAIVTYIIGCNPPAPCKFFVGRQDAIETIYNMLKEDGKVILNGVAGMGKSETAKAYARHYKKEYTNQIYIRYSGDLKKDISELDFIDDSYDFDEDVIFQKHNRFLRSLREDTLLIIDNYSEMDKQDPILSEIMNYSCHVLITTRNVLACGEQLYLEELSRQEQISLVKRLYKDADEESHGLRNILHYVHGHTYAIELVARLLQSGIMSQDQLENRLFFEQGGMAATDKIKTSRLGRSYRDLSEQWRIIKKEKGADVVVIDMPILDTRREKNLLGTFISDLILALLSYVAESEYRTIHQRQAEGIAAAKARGFKFGRPPKGLPENFHEVYQKWKSGKLSVTEAARECDMPRSTFYYKAKVYNNAKYINE